MKIEKVEDLRKLKWRTLTDEEWKIIRTRTYVFVPDEEYVVKNEIERLVENKYQEIARKAFLPIEETFSLLRKENYAFHKQLNYEEEKINIEDVEILRRLLKIPEIFDEQTLFQQFEQLTEKEKAHFVAEIWKGYIAPELSQLLHN